MAHKRLEIRDYMQVLLATECPTLNNNVFVGRFSPVDDQSIPCTIINIDNEQSEISTTMAGGVIGSARLSQRVLSIRLETYVKHGSDITVLLSQISAEIEVAMAQDVTFNDLALDNAIVAYDEILSGDQSTASQAVKTGYSETMYQILYNCPENNPEV